MILATFNCFEILYSIAFRELDDVNIAVDLINFVIDLIYLMDVLINFRTTFVDNKTGAEVINQKRIAFNYLKGRL
jgi:hypothetical protein